ncbi:hypothetical protein LEMLEM_LOCUS17681, partial [Lemmus lemmus]
MALPGAGKMSWWLRVHTALPEDSSSILSTYIRWLPTSCNTTVENPTHSS